MHTGIKPINNAIKIINIRILPLPVKKLPVEKKLSLPEQNFINKTFNPAGKKYPTIKSALEGKKEFDMVIDHGKVIRVLPEDNIGSRHQLFILQTSEAKSIKISHNISIAQRIPELKEGLQLAIKGEIVKSDKVVHWTHKNPAFLAEPHEGGGIIILSKGSNYLKVIE